jgi:hypothetical protein
MSAPTVRAYGSACTQLLSAVLQIILAYRIVNGGGCFVIPKHEGKVRKFARERFRC